MKTYKGRYKPSNPSKYVGDIDNVVYRSGWERHVMKWCDTNSDVVQWMSEELIIPYICETDNKPHRYFMDFVIKFRSGRVVLVEVKPEKETKRPQRKQGKSRQTLLNEGLTYIKNQSKWKAAQEYALDRGYHFEIWTEKELTAMGIMPKSTQRMRTKKPLKKLAPFRKKKKRV
jgi:hypothetical protein